MVKFCRAPAFAVIITFDVSQGRRSEIWEDDDEATTMRGKRGVTGCETIYYLKEKIACPPFTREPVQKVLVTLLAIPYDINESLPAMIRVYFAVIKYRYHTNDDEYIIK